MSLLYVLHRRSVYWIKRFPYQPNPSTKTTDIGAYYFCISTVYFFPFGCMQNKTSGSVVCYNWPNKMTTNCFYNYVAWIHTRTCIGKFLKYMPTSIRFTATTPRIEELAKHKDYKNYARSSRCVR